MAKQFEVTLLGVNSAYPIHGRHPSCQILNYDGKLIMIDCGEAAQIQLSRFHIKRSKISHILISHLHGDHCYGLPGVLTSFTLQGRTSKLTLIGPEGLAPYINGVLETTYVHLGFDVDIIAVSTKKPSSFEICPELTLTTFPLQHRVPTIGFRFDEKQIEFNIDKDAIGKYGLTIDEIKRVKKGFDIERDGKTISNSVLSLPQKEARSYCYCSDTTHDPGIVDYLSGAGLLYHETTYLDDLKHLAKERMHSTLGQAIDIAKRSKIKQLITGHYSSRYKDIGVFFEKGIQSFPGLLLGVEGKVYKV